MPIACATADGTTTARGAGTDANDILWLRDAIETTRDDINTVTGSGVIRSVWIYKGDRYTVRDNAGGTAGVLWKNTSSGWEAQSLGYELTFTSGGTTEVAEGDILIGVTSAARGTVGRVILTSGTWAGGDAAGRFILTSQTGTFESEILNTAATANIATIAADSSANTLPAAGRYEFINHNFSGASDLVRMYGIQGVGKAFEWDGSVFVNLTTGMTTDVPTHIGVYKNHLFLSFAGGSSQQSSITNPYEWSVVTGASEIGMGQDITAYVREVGKSMLVFCRNKVGQLFGNDSTDFVLDTLSEEAGGIANTMQVIGKPIYMDDRGLRDVTTTREYGDFKMGTISQMVEPLFRGNKKNGITPVGSLRCREKDQYRLFWSDGTGLTCYLGRKKPEFIPFDYDKVISCTCSGEDSNGNEIMLFGSSDGYVYQIDSGTSYDGETVTAYLRLAFNHIGSPSHNKRWHKAALELDAQPSTAIGVLADFSYADDELAATTQQDFTVSGGGAFWDENTWDDFFWSSPVEGVAHAYIDGIGKNISLAIISDVAYEEPHVIHGVTLHYSERGLVR